MQIYVVWIYALCNKAVSSFDCISCHGWMIVYELERVWTEAAVAWFEGEHRELAGGNETPCFMRTDIGIKYPSRTSKSERWYVA
jgi:hypothetical protein